MSDVFPASPRFPRRPRRAIPAEAHRGTRREKLERHCEEALAAFWDPEKRPVLRSKLFDRICSQDYLRHSYDELVSKGGRAPGVDGISYDDLDESQIWQLVRYTSNQLKDGSFRPERDRTVYIPKHPGQRRLDIPTIGDRMVYRNISQILGPFLDPLFGDLVFGFRPKRSRMLALARAEAIAKRGDLWVVVCDDIRNAFPSVPHGRLLDLVRLYLKEPRICALLEVIIRSHNNGSGASPHGIRQGGSLSPLLLTLYLNHSVVRPWRKRMPHVPLFLWADDIMLLCRDHQEAEHAYCELARIVKNARMKLKGTEASGIHDLSTTHAEWLGYRFTRSPEGYCVYPAEAARDRLHERLAECEYQEMSPIRAEYVMLSWLSNLGPCVANMDVESVLSDVVAIANEHGFREPPRREDMLAVLRKSHFKWEHARSNSGS